MAAAVMCAGQTAAQMKMQNLPLQAVKTEHVTQLRRNTGSPSGAPSATRGHLRGGGDS